MRAESALADLARRYPCNITPFPNSALLLVTAVGSGKSRQIIPEENGGIVQALQRAYESMLVELHAE